MSQSHAGDHAQCVPEYPPPPPPISQPGVDHMMSVNGVASSSSLPVGVALDTLAQIPAQAILEALAAKSKAELGHYRKDLDKLGEKVGKKLVPLWKSEQVPQGCLRCHSIHARCDGKRPCGRCMSRGVEAHCVYPSDPDFMPPPRKQRARQKSQMEEEDLVHHGDNPPRRHFEEEQIVECIPEAMSSRAVNSVIAVRPQLPPSAVRCPQNRPARGSMRPMPREGVTPSGDILCVHGIEKRYCLDEVCVANGGGKAMCQHGRRRRTCKEPECKSETERKRLEVESRRCEHGRQKRLCREGNCLSEFSAAGKAYRDMMQLRRADAIAASQGISVPTCGKSTRKLCEHPGCALAAAYGLQRDGQRLSCAMHKLDNYVDLTRDACVPSKLHRRTDFIDDSIKRCEHVDPPTDNSPDGIICVQSANYGDAGERKRRYCRVHKRPTDVQLARKRKHGGTAMSYLDAAGPTPAALIDARNTDSEDTGDGEIVVQVEDDNGVDGVVIGVDGVGAGGEAGGGLLNDAQMGHSQFQGQGVTVDSAGPEHCDGEAPSVSADEPPGEAVGEGEGEGEGEGTEGVGAMMMESEAMGQVGGLSHGEISRAFVPRFDAPPSHDVELEEPDHPCPPPPEDDAVK